MTEHDKLVEDIIDVLDDVDWIIVYDTPYEGCEIDDWQIHLVDKNKAEKKMKKDKYKMKARCGQKIRIDDLLALEELAIHRDTVDTFCEECLEYILMNPEKYKIKTLLSYEFEAY